jgi:hypothetical protein
MLTKRASLSSNHRMHPRTNHGVTRLVFPMMRMFRGLVIYLALLLLALSSSIAAAQPLHHAQSPERLKAAFTNLKSTPNSRTAQHHYLTAFPHSFTRFQAYFGAGGALADGYECDYIFALSTLQSHHVAEVGSLLVGLSKDAKLQGNAPNCLHNVMANYGSHFTKSFAAFLHQLSPQQREQLINFLADVESANYPEYRTIIQNLKGLNESDLAKEFQQAQAERSKQSRRQGNLGDFGNPGYPPSPGHPTASQIGVDFRWCHPSLIPDWRGVQRSIPNWRRVQDIRGWSWFS